MPAAAATFALFVVLVFRLLDTQTPSDIGVLTPLTVGFWLVSWMFPVLTGLAIFMVISQYEHRQEVGVAVWHHS